MDIKLNDMLSDVQLADDTFNLLNPEGYYRLKIPNEERHYYKNKGYIRGYTNSTVSNTSLGYVKNLYTSSAIEIQPNDIIQILIPKTLLERTYEQYKQYTTVSKNCIALFLSPDKPRINDNGQVDFTDLPLITTFGFVTNNGELTKYTIEKQLPVVYKNSEFFDLDFYVFTREITQEIYDRFCKYIYLVDWIPGSYPQSHYIDEQNRIYNCGILRKGEDPYGNWQEQQNNLAFKHYLYQSHIRKEK